MKNLFCVVVFLLFHSLIYSQNNISPFCGFETEMEENMSNSKFEERLNVLESKILNASQYSMKSAPKTIPVVVHIIHPPGVSIGQGNNLSDNDVEKGLELLNQSFSNAGPFNTSDGVDTEIQFCLAKRTPNGEITNGITRHSSNLVADLQCGDYSTNQSNGAAIKSIVSWGCKEYLNIWLVTDLYNGTFGCSLAGFATFPGTSCSVDGVLQESKYWTTVSGTSVTAHELGHYLGLYHTFTGGCKNDNCLIDGDRVCDTPPDGSQSFAPCNTNSCNTDVPDLQDDNYNYMDYSSCSPGHFTLGQKTRMQNGLLFGRPELLNSLGCEPLAANDLALVYNGNACDSKYCPSFTVINKGTNTINTFEIVHGFPSLGIQETFAWTGELKPNEEVTLSFDCVDIMPGLHTLEASINMVNGAMDEFAVNSELSNQILISAQESFFKEYSISHYFKFFKNLSKNANTYLWDFGDGSTSTDKDPSHLYQNPGTYTVTLTSYGVCDTTTYTSEVSIAGCDNGWRGFVKYGATQVEDQELCEFIKNGELRISSEINNLESYRTHFNFCNQICSGENFKIQFRFKNGTDIGGLSAYDPSFSIQSGDYRAGIQMMGEN